MQDGGCIEFKMSISLNFRLNLERMCVRFYGSINPIESVKLPSVNYFDESKMATSKMAVSKRRPFVVLRPGTALSPQLHSITILEGNRGNCRYHFESIIMVVMRLPNVYEAATISDWGTGGWYI